MDAHDMWRDTMLIVNTDHGFLLGEHDWWGKNAMPDFNEIAHTPLFIWDPVSGVCGERRSALTQTIDLAPTLLAFFGSPIPPDMRGRSLLPVIRKTLRRTDYALFGYFNGPINITDGRYVYMRARVDDAVQMHQYTMMPTRWTTACRWNSSGRRSLRRRSRSRRAAPMFRIPVPRRTASCRAAGTGCTTLRRTPKQTQPADEGETEARLLRAMGRLLAENDAPEAVYTTYGIPHPTE